MFVIYSSEKFLAQNKLQENIAAAHLSDCPHRYLKIISVTGATQFISGSESFVSSAGSFARRGLGRKHGEQGHEWSHKSTTARILKHFCLKLP